MPGGNVQLVKSLMAAVDARDIDAFAVVTTPDFVWFPVFAARVGGDVYRGREGSKRSLARSTRPGRNFAPCQRSTAISATACLRSVG